MKKLLSVLFVLFSSSSFAEEISERDTEALGEEISSQEFYAYMQNALDDKNWWAAIDYGQIILNHFPDSPLSQEISYYVGKSYYELNQHELANQALSDYLKGTNAPKHFEEAIGMKFLIAEFYKQGGRKHLFSSHKLPAIMGAEEDALVIYDEVITTLPHQTMGAKALLGKADIQAILEDFKPSIETLQLLIRRFPKDELAAEGYLKINQVYLQQCQSQRSDPELLSLAGLNLNKFRQAFPREPRLTKAELAFQQMQEVFAEQLLDTGKFFQKRKKKDASILYYKKIIKTYPNSHAALQAEKRLESLEAIKS